MDVLPPHLRESLIPAKEQQARIAAAGALLRGEGVVAIAKLPSEEIAGIVAVAATAETLPDPSPAQQPAE